MSIKTQVQKTAVYRGRKLVLKPNGLPAGFGLFWKTVGEKRYIYVKIDGKGLSCSTDDWRHAVDFSEKQRTELKKREGQIPAGDVLIKELFSDYIEHLELKALKRGDYKPKTPQFTKNSIDRHLMKPFGEMKASRLRSQDYEEYRRKRTAECIAQGKAAERVQYTIDHELGYLRSALYLGAKNGKVNKASIPLFNIDKSNSLIGAKHGVISEDQFTTLCQTLPDHVLPMFVFCNVTAVRKREATFVHRSEVNWDQRLVTLRANETKQGRARTVAISKALWSFIWKWEQRTRQAHPNAEYLFHLNGQQLSTGQLDAAFNRTW